MPLHITAKSYSVICLKETLNKCWSYRQLAAYSHGYLPCMHALHNLTLTQSKNVTHHCLPCRLLTTWSHRTKLQRWISHTCKFVHAVQGVQPHMHTAPIKALRTRMTACELKSGWNDAMCVRTHIPHKFPIINLCAKVSHSSLLLCDKASSDLPGASKGLRWLCFTFLVYLGLISKQAKGGGAS